jgi:MoaA/NifB/PqqE/SkfB family radical SAM enzyme
MSRHCKRLAAESPVWARPTYGPHGEPTRRGWLVLGQNGGACDQRCQMCYFAHQKERHFYHLDTLLGLANRMRWYYGLETAALSGGEITILPGAEQLIRHCAHIGLQPTAFTHGQNSTAELVERFEAAGLDRWTVSLHGLQAGHNAVLQRDDAWQRLVGNLRHYHRPVIVNTTVLRQNVTELPGLAQFLVDSMPPTAWTMLTFMPFWDWAGLKHIEFQVKLSEAASYYARAIELVQAHGWEADARYFLPCIAAEHGFAANCVNFYGSQYDALEWDLLSTNRAAMPTRVGSPDFWPRVIEARRKLCDQIAKTRANDRCDACRFHPICEGPAEQYARQYGYDELRPVQGEPVYDICYFERGGQFE